MLETTKHKLLEEAKEHLVYIRDCIKVTLQSKEAQTSRLRKDVIGMSPGDSIAQYALVAHYQEYLEDLKQLHPSPYFAACEFEIDGVNRKMYFGKFSFSEEGVYSWITPVAALRFEEPGPASYVRPNGTSRSGIVRSKDQYLINNGKIPFCSTEGIGLPRELIHQEHFTQHKEGFVLPEVVEQMEKAQDQIIRAHYQGPFAISGPAGSGKTTLALHRVAFLAQSPETAEYFKPESMIVLVQDDGTKEYFSHLLPDLGIRGVQICTFAEWAMDLLGLEGYAFAYHLGEEDAYRYNYEYAKLRALRSNITASYSKNIYVTLSMIYENFFSKDTDSLWQEQKKKKQLDRFDLTILLLIHRREKGELTQVRRFHKLLNSGKYRETKDIIPAKYNLLIVDEFQNYLPEQLDIIKGCANKRLESVVYVGDLAQQTRLGTIRSWGDIGESFAKDRLVSLEKVYRNTKQILGYIQSLGYGVQIPDSIKDGPEVEEKILPDKGSEIAYIDSKLGDLSQITVGILSKKKEYLTEFKDYYQGNEKIFCLSFEETQGVEFDKVFIVGVEENMFETTGIATEILPQIHKMQRDLLYVALTRAMRELYVVGKSKLKIQ